jgi:DNA ligase (NAD+)
MTPAEAKKRIAELREQITHHDELYYRKALPEIEDFEYDQLKTELRRQEELYPEIAAALGESPLNRVGDDRAEGFERAKHLQAMTTLENTYDESELREFHSRLGKQLPNEELVYSVEPKIDGASINLVFEKGRLVRAITRGDGEEGDDVTSNVQTIRDLPKKLRQESSFAIPDTLEIRGEIFLRFEEFAAINKRQVEEGLQPYANPRNLAAGTLKLLDVDVVKDRKLEIVLYAIGASSPALAVKTQAELHDALRAWGLPVLEHQSTTRGIEETLQVVRQLDGLRKRLPYATDGAVVKLNDFSLQSRVGYRGEGQSARKLSPRWACAFKFPPERAETQLSGITIQVGRTGVLTPVAELIPVPLSGTTVGRATLHNRDEIERKDVRIGDYVFIEKKGEIIPAVVKVNLLRRPPNCERYIFPTTCPSCHSQVVSSPDEVAIRCPNQNCPDQLIARLDYIAGRPVLDIDGLGGSVAARLVEKGVVKDFFDLFQLKHETLARLEKSASSGLTKSGAARKAPEIGDRNATKILESISRARGLGLSRWIMAMQIPGVGAATAQELAATFGSFHALRDSPLLELIVRKSVLERERVDVSPRSRKNPPRDELERASRARRTNEIETTVRQIDSEIAGITANPPIGAVAAKHVISAFSSARGSAFLAKLSELQINPVATSGPVIGPFTGKTFVLTGTLNAFDRHIAKQKIESRGGKVVGKVSKETDYLVASLDATGAKFDDATRLGVAILREPEFLKMIDHSSSGESSTGSAQSQLSLG